MQFKSNKTERNLLKTFAGEARARNKYTFYAEKAKLQGHEYSAVYNHEYTYRCSRHESQVDYTYMPINKDVFEEIDQGYVNESEKL